MSVWGSGRRGGCDDSLNALAERMYNILMTTPKADLHCIPDGDAILLCHHVNRNCGLKEDQLTRPRPGSRFMVNGRNFLVYTYEEGKR